MSYESWRISYQSSEQAARAAYARVEELSARLAKQAGPVSDAWISVADAMPNTQQQVDIAYIDYHGRPQTTMGWYCRAKTLESSSFDGEVNDEYDEDAGAFYLKEQWVDESQESEYHYPITGVTHWKPRAKHPDFNPQAKEIEMKERPILFSAPMVRAILAGQKTQTRRIFKEKNGGVQPRANDIPGMRQILRNCPYGEPGDRLWVKEPYRFPDSLDDKAPSRIADMAVDAGYNKPWCPTQWEADGCMSSIAEWRGFMTPPAVAKPGKLRPSIHMPRWASRILLEVASVRVERLQDISAADCIAEGAPGGHGAIPGYAYNATPQEHYWHIWTSINGAASWDANPWVWVVEFKRVESPKVED